MALSDFQTQLNALDAQASTVTSSVASEKSANAALSKAQEDLSCAQAQREDEATKLDTALATFRKALDAYKSEAVIQRVQ